MFAAVIAAAAVSLALASTASAAQLEVTTTTDELAANSNCSLREAVQTANGNGDYNECGSAADLADEIIFDAAVFPVDDVNQQINLLFVGGELIVGSDLEILGPGIDELEITNSNAVDRIFRVDNDNTVAMSDLSITGGHQSAAGAVSGAGIENDGDLTLTNVRVANHTLTSTIAPAGTGTPSAVGAGINSSGTLSLIHAIVEGNFADATSNSAVDAATLAEGAGIRSTGMLEVDFSTVALNNATESTNGGALAGAAYGGGIAASGGLDVRRSTISGNGASSLATGGAPTTNVTEGGGLRISGVAGTLDVSTVSGNSVNRTAGGSGFNRGGGIAVGSGGLDVTSSTIADNGFGNSSGVTATGANVYGAGLASFSNSIISDPRAGDANCNAAATSADFNIEHKPGGGTSCGLGGTNDLNQDPLLGTLTDNGGPTETMLPAPLSPAIDQGSDNNQFAPTEQRGFTRNANFANILDADNGEDIGPVEIQIAPPTFSGIAPTPPSSDDTPTVTGNVLNHPDVLSNNPMVRLFTVAGCSSGATGPLTAAADFLSPGITVDPVAHNTTTTFHGRVTSAYGNSSCSSGAFPNTIAYTQADPPTTPSPVTTPPAVTGQRAAALKRCAKSKNRKKKKKCKKRARRLPV